MGLVAFNLKCMILRNSDSYTEGPAVSVLADAVSTINANGQHG